MNYVVMVRISACEMGGKYDCAWDKTKMLPKLWGEIIFFADATEKHCKNLVEKLIVFPEKQKPCKNWVEKLTVSKGHSGEIF